METTQSLTECMKSLEHLKNLYESNQITLEDYELRKSQIVDKVTGTVGIVSKKQHSSNQICDTDKRKNLYSNDANNDYSSNNNSNHNNNKTTPKIQKFEVVPHSPPDWSKICAEKAEKWIYNYTTNQWRKETCKVKIDNQPFAKGNLRYVFYLQDLSCPKEQWVAKISQDVRDNITHNIYFNDVRIQAIARHFCHDPHGYNSYNPPKKVDFLEAYVLHFKHREDLSICHIEKYISGDYKKYNNNVGWVSEDERNTPQAFAHFTYESSNHKLLVCDIQGVNDTYIDPQIHTSELQHAFGKGNLGKKGFENFLHSHRCNSICQYLKLPNINTLPITERGTLPAKTQMTQTEIDTINFDFNEGTIIPRLKTRKNKNMKGIDYLLHNVIMALLTIKKANNVAK